MPLSKQQAEAALQDIGQVEHRAFTFRGYERGAPHLVLWGVIWMLGYGFAGVFPESAWLIWMVLWGCGLLGSYLIGRAAGSTNAHVRSNWRLLASGAALFAFVMATYAVMAPQNSAQFGAFPPLIIAFIYMLAGIWGGVRWMIAGLVVGTLTLIGYVFLREHFMLWMAAVGGGALILTGAWMRRM
jgi:hypothetical protein